MRIDRMRQSTYVIRCVVVVNVTFLSFVLVPEEGSKKKSKILTRHPEKSGRPPLIIHGERAQQL